MHDLCVLDYEFKDVDFGARRVGQKPRDHLNHLEIVTAKVRVDRQQNIQLVGEDGVEDVHI